MFSDLYQNCLERYSASDTSVDLATWICENTTIQKKPFSFKQYPFQEAIARDEHLNLSCEKCSQVGLAAHVDTPLPTPTGWTTMGEVQVGDQLFDENGKPTTVTYKSPVWVDRDCYEVEFDTGEVITCDGSHRWYVEACKPFNSEGVWDGCGPPPKADGFAKAGVVNTSMLAKKWTHNGRYIFSIPTTKPLDFPNADLLVDPYFLGLWLGDGTLNECRLASSTEDAAFYEKELVRRGYQTKTKLVDGTNTCYIRVYSSDQKEFGQGHKHLLAQTMTSMGLLRRKKTIPTEYLRADEAQRWDLLRGLMDSDGCIDKRGQAIFKNCDPHLIDGVAELVRSLGLKCSVRWRTVGSRKFRNVEGERNCQDECTLSFTAYLEKPPVALPRKLARLRASAHSKATHHRIIDIRKVASVPTQCITVDSPSHLYLCGKGLIPTHNTEIQIRKFFAILRRNSTVSGIFSLPTEKMYKRVYNGRMKPILDADPVFNPPMGSPPVRNMGMVQIMDSFGYITGCTEGDATSISADFLMHDELDLSPMDMIGLFQSRLQNSDLKMTQAFSTPTFLDYGINRQYSLSDQREYLIKCSSCNHWQAPTFDFRFLQIPLLKTEDFEKITDITSEIINQLPLEQAYVCCEKCRSQLDLANSEMREWVATYPTRINARGYKVRPFSTARISPAYIFSQLGKYQQNDFIRGFHNTVLGEPFTESSAQMQRNEIEDCMAPNGAIPNIGRERPVFLGLDMGQVCHLTLNCDDDDGNVVFVLFEQVPIFQLFQRLRELGSIYSIVQGCVDRFPYTPTADQMRDDSAGTIMPVQYAGKAYVQPHKDETGSIDYYSANRTATLDRVRSVITNKQVVLAGYGPYRETIITHLRDMVRDEKPDVEPEWKKLNGNDHFFHSMALGILARRVCEHVYTVDTKSLLSNAIVTGVSMTSAVSDLGNNRGVSRISKLK